MTWSVTGTLRTSVWISRICSPVSTGVISSTCDAGRPPGDLELLLEARVLHEHLEHEAVLLRFGQRVGAFLLDRVLRREHEERVGELVADAADRYLPLLHRFEQRGLRLAAACG